MCKILEHRNLDKMIARLPEQIVKKYELWKDIIYRNGPEKLKEFKGFHNEKLSGNRSGRRSSGLNLKYRVIDEVDEDVVTVYVIEITPHIY